MIAQKKKNGFVFVEPEDRPQGQAGSHFPKAGRMQLSQAQARMFLRIRKSDFQIQD